MKNEIAVFALLNLYTLKIWRPVQIFGLQHTKSPVSFTMEHRSRSFASDIKAHVEYFCNFLSNNSCSHCLGSWTLPSLWRRDLSKNRDFYSKTDFTSHLCDNKDCLNISVRRNTILTSYNIKKTLFFVFQRAMFSNCFMEIFSAKSIDIAKNDTNGSSTCHNSSF